MGKRRLISYPLTLIAIITLLFFMMKAVPGDPFTDERPLPAKTKEALIHYWGLDAPWYVQYIGYVKSILTWDFGPSYIYQDYSVNAIIKDGFPISALLGLEALAIAITFGVLFGTLSAVYDTPVITLCSILCISIPSFILATLLQYSFALKLGLLPLARWGTWQHTLLPATALALHPAAFLARLIRSHMIETFKQDFIHTAKAKGLPKITIVIKHALRCAILPIFPYMGPLVTNILVGSFVIEHIFAIPGMGHWIINSVSNRDYSVIMGITTFYSILLLSLVFIMDLLYYYLDPRLRSCKN